MSCVEEEINDYLSSVAAVGRQVEAKAVRDVVDVFDRAHREQGTVFLAVAFSGSDGGKAKEYADVAVLVPSRNTQIVEDIHMVLGHVTFTPPRDRMGGDEVEVTSDTR